MWTVSRLSKFFGLIDIIACPIFLVLNMAVLVCQDQSLILIVTRVIEIIFAPIIFWYGIHLRWPAIPKPENTVAKRDLLINHLIIAVLVYPVFVAVFAIPALVTAIFYIQWKETTVQELRTSGISIDIRSERDQRFMMIRDAPQHAGRLAMYQRYGIAVGGASKALG